MLVQVRVGGPSGRKRRSTRILRAVPLTVTGVDSVRAPYAEQVSTVEISSHGCKYNSKYEVFQGQLVTLQMGQNDQEHAACSVRAVVKWVQRPRTAKEPFQVATELEVPGNVWGVELPPDDWLPFPETKFPETKVIEARGATPESLAVAQATPPVSAPKPNRGSGQQPNSLAAQAPAPLSPLIAHLMSEFGEQVQKMVSEAAAAAAAVETGRLLAELRTQLGDEVKKTMQGLAASHTDQWVRWLTQQMNQAHQATAKTLHEQWTKMLELDLRQASERLAARNAELNQHAENLAANVQRVFEVSQRDWVARLISRLQQQLTPLLEHAQGASTKLAAYKQEVEQTSVTQRDAFEKGLQQAVVRSAASIQEMSDRLERQFEQAMSERLAKAFEELEQKTTAATQASLESIGQASQSYVGRTQAGLQAALQPVLEQATKGLQEKAEEISRLFAHRLDGYSRSYLEHISKLMAELAQRIGNV